MSEPEEPQSNPYGEPNYGNSAGSGPNYSSPSYGSAPPPPPTQPMQPAAPSNYPVAPDPQNPYGAPMPPPSPYGPAFGGPSELAPSKAMAITAMVLAFLACIPILPLIAIVLAIVVLVRSKDGRNHGKGLAIGALIVAPITLIAVTTLIVAAVIFAANSKDVNDLSARECFNGIKASGHFSNLRTVACSDPHDAQVLATVTLNSSEAREYPLSDSIGGQLCAVAIGGDVSVRNYLDHPELEPLLLTDRKRPRAGDKLACIVHRTDGEKITDSLDNPDTSTDSGTGSSA